MLPLTLEFLFDERDEDFDLIKQAPLIGMDAQLFGVVPAVRNQPAGRIFKMISRLEN